MKHKIFFILILIVFSIQSINAQHFIGIKNAYGIMGVDDNPDIDTKTITTVFNPGLVYQYKHKEYFAFQTEFNYLSKGYLLDSTSHHIKSYQLPILGQGYIRLGAFRPYLTGGAFIGYIGKTKLEKDGNTQSYVYDDYDRRFEYGILGGAGVGVTLSKFELQAEWRYEYTFSFLRKPHIDNITQYLNTTQMMISLTLFYRLSN